jgi:hypothetical protein
MKKRTIAFSSSNFCALTKKEMDSRISEALLEPKSLQSVGILC